MGKKTDLTVSLSLFKKKVSKDYPLQKMILFGSRARGNATKDSDVDLLLVSTKFRELDAVERGVKMYNYWELRLPVDFVCYSPEEFKQLLGRVSLVSDAVEHGVVI